MSGRQSKGEGVPPELLAKLRAAAAELGEQKLIERLGLNPMTVARAVGGFGVNRGTVAAVQLFLNERDKAA